MQGGRAHNIIIAISYNMHSYLASGCTIAIYSVMQL